jgi:DNA-binding transcriptional regulator/RsmH inhibitor MraZ
MFIGRYYYTVENKGRVTLPKPLRDQLENEDAELVLTRGLDGGLFLFPKPLFTNKLHALLHIKEIATSLAI